MDFKIDFDFIYYKIEEQITDLTNILKLLLTFSLIFITILLLKIYKKFKQRKNISSQGSQGLPSSEESLILRPKQVISKQFMNDTQWKEAVPNMSNLRNSIFKDKLEIPLNFLNNKAELSIKLEKKNGVVTKTELHSLITQYQIKDFENSFIKQDFVEKQFNVIGQEQNGVKELIIKEKPEIQDEEFLIRKNSSTDHPQSELFETGRFYKLFRNQELIGQGGFGEVFKSEHKIEMKIYAVKRVYFLISNNQKIENHKYFREVQTLTKLDHPNIIRFYSMWIEEAGDQFLQSWKTFVQFKKTSKQFLSPAIQKKILPKLQTPKTVSQNPQYNMTPLNSLGFEWDVQSKDNIKPEIISEESYSDSYQQQHQANQRGSVYKMDSRYLDIMENISHGVNLIFSYPIVLHIQVEQLKRCISVLRLH